MMQNLTKTRTLYNNMLHHIDCIRCCKSNMLNVLRTDSVWFQLSLVLHMTLMHSPRSSYHSSLLSLIRTTSKSSLLYVYSSSLSDQIVHPSKLLRMHT